MRFVFQFLALFMFIQLSMLSQLSHHSFFQSSAQHQLLTVIPEDSCCIAEQRRYQSAHGAAIAWKSSLRPSPSLSPGNTRRNSNYFFASHCISRGLIISNRLVWGKTRTGKLSIICAHQRKLMTQAGRRRRSCILLRCPVSPTTEQEHEKCLYLNVF